MSDDVEQARGLAANIIGSPAYEALPPPARPFQAWHRPRKQYVRSEQWTVQIEKLCDDLGSDLRSLRYLGLPGRDLLDLRYFHSRVCAPRGLTLLFLGFDSGSTEDSPSRIEQNISLDQVRKLSQVDPRSLIIQDDICSLANPESIGSKHAEDLGPYDVVNLDLCDGFGKESPDATRWNQYEALGKLLALQFRNKNPWLLLLTTRTGDSHVHKEFLEKLVSKYMANLSDCAEFRTASTQEFGISDHSQLAEALVDDIQMLPIFLTGLCKWIAGIAVSNSPPSKIEVKSVIGYKIAQTSPCEDMISLAIRFFPQMSTVLDPAGVIRPAANVPNECAISVQAVKRIAKRKNADTELQEDLELRTEMAVSMADLLTEARYDRTSFAEWVSSIEGWQMS